jgi:hypothetical protein
MKLNFKIKKIGLGLSAIMAVLGLFVSPTLALAGSPNMTLSYLGTNNDDPNDGWIKNVNVTTGQKVKFNLEIHNTVVGTTATNVQVKATLPSSTGDSVATVMTDNAGNITDTVHINVNGGGTLQYIPGTTQVTWDKDGDGVKEFNNTVVGDGITGSGLTLGDQNGCNAYIIQVSFLAQVVGGTTPTPTPSPTPTPVATATPTPTPGTGGQSQSQTQTQNNNQTQNVTITNNSTPAVITASVPTKLPATGPDVLGLATMFGAAPLGVVMSRYGRGRLTIKKEDEDLNSIANDLVKARNGQA